MSERKILEDDFCYMFLVLDESLFSPEISDSQFEDKDWSDFKSLRDAMV